MPNAIDIVTHPAFIPAFGGLIVGMFIGMLTAFCAEWWVQSSVHRMRRRMDPGGFITPNDGLIGKRSGR